MEIYKSITNLKFFDDNLEKIYLEKNYDKKKMIIYTSIIAILCIINTLLLIPINSSESKYLFIFIHSILLLVIGISSFILIFFISLKKSNFTFILLLINSFMISYIIQSFNISLQKNSSENILKFFFIFFFKEIFYPFKIILIIYLDNNFLRNFISISLMIVISWFQALYLFNYPHINYYIPINFTMVMISLCIFSYFYEKNYKKDFKIKFELSSNGLISNKILWSLNSGIIIFNKLDEVYTNEFIKTYFSKFFIFPVNNNQKNQSRDDKMVFEKIQNENFMENLTNINPNLPSEILNFFIQKRFIFKNFLNSIVKCKSFYDSKVYCGETLIDGRLNFEIYVKVNIIELNEYNIEFIIEHDFKKNLISKIAHEFKNPLISIKEVIHQLDENRICERKQEYINYSKVQIEYMINLVSNFIHLTDYDYKTTIEITNVNIKNLCEFCINFVNTIKKSNIIITSFIDPKLPSFIKTDKQKLYQILINLLTNSIKFTLGTIMIKIKFAVINNNSYVKFKIIDSGCWFDNTSYKYPFEIPYKIELENNSFFLGFSLSLVKDLTNLLGIAAKYKRNQAKGLSEIFFYINLNTNEEEIKNNSGSTVKTEKTFNKKFILPFFKTKLLNQNLEKHDNNFILENINFIKEDNCNINFTIKLNIIIIDDDYLVRSSQASIITKYFSSLMKDVEIYEGSDGLECLYYIYQLLKDGKKIDYIFMDETMQFLSGTCCMEIISNLKKKSLIPSIDVYIVTAYEDLSSHNHILSFGVKKIITKPLSYSKLKQTLE